MILSENWVLHTKGNTYTVSIPSIVQKYENYNQSVVYENRFSLKRKEYKRYFIHFEAVNYKATVILNGTIVGEHEGGYTPFELEITDFLKDDNTIKVEVFHQDENMDEYPCWKETWYYPFTGIWGKVEILEKSRSYIKDSP